MWQADNLEIVDDFVIDDTEYVVYIDNKGNEKKAPVQYDNDGTYIIVYGQYVPLF